MEQVQSESIVGLGTLVEVVRAWSEEQPGSVAFTFLGSGEPAGQLTYAGLDTQSRAIGALLQAHAAPGDRVVLIYPAGLDFIPAFFGCLYSGMIAVPVYPPHPSGSDLPRLLAILESAAPVVALTTMPVLALLEQAVATIPQLGAIRWLATDTLAPEAAGDWREPDIDDETIAFLQYTSGSTALPKGVMVTHGNLIHNQRMIMHSFGHTHETSYVNWLPLYHDMGLIGNVIQVIYLGTHCAFMSPLSFLKRPYSWLQAVSRYRANTSGAPNFAYDLCVRKVTPEQRETLDLSSWTHAYNGAEPVRAATLERFAETFRPCGFNPDAFYPCYGLAEGTLFIAGALPGGKPTMKVFRKSALAQNRAEESTFEDEDMVKLVASGRASLGEKIVIADPETRTACPPGQIGEIWLSGPMVTKGYWNLPEETGQSFDVYLSDTGDGPFLRTGDLGFLDGGLLFVTGRIKDLIIIAGRNHYPQDIELTVERSTPAAHPGGTIAFSVEGEQEERLVVVMETLPDYREPEAQEEVVRAVQKAVSETHGVRVSDVVLLSQHVPKTTSGKHQRRACRTDYLAGRLQRLEVSHE